MIQATIVIPEKRFHAGHQEDILQLFVSDSRNPLSIRWWLALSLVDCQ